MASNGGAYQITKTRTRAPDTLQRSGDFSPTSRSKKSVEATQLERAVENKRCTVRHPKDAWKYSVEYSETDQGLAIEQAHSSLLLGEMGER